MYEAGEVRCSQVALQRIGRMLCIISFLGRTAAFITIHKLEGLKSFEGCITEWSQESQECMASSSKHCFSLGAC